MDVPESGNGGRAQVLNPGKILERDMYICRYDARNKRICHEYSVKNQISNSKYSIQLFSTTNLKVRQYTVRSSSHNQPSMSLDLKLNTPKRLGAVLAGALLVTAASVYAAKQSIKEKRRTALDEYKLQSQKRSQEGPTQDSYTADSNP